MASIITGLHCRETEEQLAARSPQQNPGSNQSGTCDRAAPWLSRTQNSCQPRDRPTLSKNLAGGIASAPYINGRKKDQIRPESSEKVWAGAQLIIMMHRLQKQLKTKTWQIKAPVWECRVGNMMFHDTQLSGSHSMRELTSQFYNCSH